MGRSTIATTVIVIGILTSLACTKSRTRGSEQIDADLDAGFEMSIDGDTDAESDTGAQSDTGAESDTGGFGDEENETECEKAYNIRMEAIQAKCAEVNLVGCCYCSCELKIQLPPGCVCSNYSLTNNTDVSTCDDIAMGQAMDCTGNLASCADKMKSIVELRCQ